MVLFKRIICINNITPDPCGHSYSELKFEDRCRRDFPVSLSVGIWNHGRLKHGLATWGPLVWVLKKPEKYNMLFTYILHRLSILWERRSPDTSDEIKCKPKSCMTTYPVLGKFACSVWFFVMVTQGWLVKSLFIKGFFLPDFPSRAISQSVPCTLAKYSIVVYFDMVKETPAKADSMRNRDK